MQLKIHDEIVIKCTKKSALQVIGTPTNWPSFINKIETLDYCNEVYTGVIKMGAKSGEFIGRLVETGDSDTIELSISFRDPATNFEVLSSIIYRVVSKGDSVKITEDIWHKQDINIFWWFLIKAIQIGGWSAEASNLENLRDLFEKSGDKADGTF